MPIVFILLLLMSVHCFPMSYRVHLSSAWYPSKKRELLQVMNKHQHHAEQKFNMNLNPSKIRALICPHAGYEYSGDVAAAAFRLIKPGVFKRVVVLAPSHYHAFEGVALPSESYVMYKNILGTLNLDKTMLDQLGRESPLFFYDSKAHEQEHSVNVLLPFIQKYCGSDCQLVPLLIGSITASQALTIASILKEFLDDQTLLIISSDFTHYGQVFNYEPFLDDITQKIFELDSMLIEQIERASLQGFYAALQRSRATVCGQYPIMLLLALLEQQAFGNVDSYVVGYDTSASSQRNPSHSVSYVSLVISNEIRESLPITDRLTGYEKSFLLQHARNRLQDAVHHHPHGDEVEPVEHLPGVLTQSLTQKQGSFVTLHEMTKNGSSSLRGCVGTVAGKDPLYKNVADMTEAAALHDSRFSPMQPKELSHAHISISTLTPKKAVKSYHDINLGQDGIVLTSNNKSATYLPEVHQNQGWDVGQTLSSLSQKAGLPADAWKRPQTKFETFQTVHFGEKDLQPNSLQ